MMGWVVKLKRCFRANHTLIIEMKNNIRLLSQAKPEIQERSKKNKPGWRPGLLFEEAVLEISPEIESDKRATSWRYCP